MTIGTHTIRAWRDGSSVEPLKMAFPNEETARAMYAALLTNDSEYDHATLCERRGTSGYVTLLETGHRAGTVAAGLSAGTINQAMIPVVDQCFANVMAANAAEPYSHEEYDRCDRVLCAALVMLTNGDAPYANALRYWLTDSGEAISYYLTKWTRNVSCLEAGEMSQEEYDATLRWAVVCQEGDSTWTEAFETREEAVARGESLAAYTSVVDRHAANAS
jgi:hypothetical protein